MNDEEKQSIMMLEFALYCADKHPELLDEWKKSKLK